MGLELKGALFLLAEKARGVAFGRTLTLGRQGVYMGEHEYSALLAGLGRKTTPPVTHADDFFLGIGANPLMAMDVSDYEGAHFIHDINAPIGASLEEAFDTVIDGGTLEHVFNFPTSISNCMRMVRSGGHLILITPWHNFAGHGFYEFSPELYYNVLSEENGYTIDRMLISSDGCWYAVKKPSEIRTRIEIRTNNPVLLYISARRVAVNPIFSSWPQQSDYSATWISGEQQPGPPADTSFKSKLVSKFKFLGGLQNSWRDFKYRRSLAPGRNPGLLKLNQDFQLPIFPQ